MLAGLEAVCACMLSHHAGTSYFFFSFFFFVFLGLYPWHMEVPRPGVKWELQLPVYATAIATWDPSRIFSLHCSLWQYQILNPLSKARDQTHILMNTSQVCYYWAAMETPWLTLDCPKSQQSRPMPRPWADFPVTWEQGDYFRLLFEKHNSSSVLKSASTSDLDLPPASPSKKLIECLFSWHGILSSVTSDQV